MAIPRRSRFTYDGGASEFLTTYPARAWIPSQETVGGSRIAAGGAPAAYIVRTDDMLTIVLRVTEEEWPDFLALIAFAQRAQAFEWFPDADEATSFAVYLHSPAAGERLTPTRDTKYPRVFEVTLTLRGAGSVPWTPYFE
jgi:hypothetical protein